MWGPSFCLQSNEARGLQQTATFTVYSKCINTEQCVAVCPNSTKFNTALAWILTTKPAKCEADCMNCSQRLLALYLDIQHTIRWLEIPYFWIVVLFVHLLLDRTAGDYDRNDRREKARQHDNNFSASCLSLASSDCDDSNYHFANWPVLQYQHCYELCATSPINTVIHKPLFD